MWILLLFTVSLENNWDKAKNQQLLITIQTGWKLVFSEQKSSEFWWGIHTKGSIITHRCFCQQPLLLSGLTGILRRGRRTTETQRNTRRERGPDPNCIQILRSLGVLWSEMEGLHRADLTKGSTARQEHYDWGILLVRVCMRVWSVCVCVCVCVECASTSQSLLHSWTPALVLSHLFGVCVCVCVCVRVRVCSLSGFEFFGPPLERDQSSIASIGWASGFFYVLTHTVCVVGHPTLQHRVPHPLSGSKRHSVAGQADPR